MSGPKIKIEADVQSFNDQIAQLKSKIAELNASLASGSKSQYTFAGSKKQLDDLLKTAEKLTKALDAGDKKSKAYAQSLKQAASAMADAAKTSSRLETAGGASDSHVSGYFRQYSSELSSEASGIAIQRDRERTEARREHDRQQRNAQLANRAARFAGFVGGSLLGGGGGYSSLGAGAGSLLPGPWGMLAGAVGGAVGGLADRTIGPNKEEALKYSELRRSLGGITTDFETLRTSVRAATAGFGVTNLEAAELGKQFAKTAGLSGDINDDISRSVGTSAGLAQGYGIAPGQTTDFFATMRINGIGKNDLDNKRLALQIGEAVARSGSTGKMDEMLGVVSDYVKSSAQQSLTAPNYAGFTSLIASMVGSNYPGLHANPTAAAGLAGEADQGVRSGGSMGEASKFHWLSAYDHAFPGMRGTDMSLMQEAGAFGDIEKQFGHESAYWKNATPSERKRLDKLAEQIHASGYKNSAQVGLDWAASISSSDMEKNRNVQAMFGIHGVQKAAAFESLFKDQKSMGELEARLAKHGQNLDTMDGSKIAPYAEVIMGSEDDRKNYYKNIKKNLSKEDVAAGDKALAAGGDALKEFILGQIDKGITDPGLEAQKTSIELQNKMANSMDKVVDIETITKEAVLGIWRYFDKDNPLLKGIDAGDLAANGKDINGGSAFRVNAVNEAIAGIKNAKSDEEKNGIARGLLNIYDQQQGVGFPFNTRELVDNAMHQSNSSATDKSASKYGDKATLPISTGPDYKSLNRRQREVVDMVRGQTKYDALFQEAGSKYGVDPLLLEQIASQESNQNPNAVNAESNDYGMMQHNRRYWKERGINESNWRNPRINVMAAAKFMREKLDQSNGDVHEALWRYNGYNANGEKYADYAMGPYNAIHEQIPESARKAEQQAQTHRVVNDINVNVRDSRGNAIADPVRVSSVINAPRSSSLR
jgi:hypothetical protein